MSICKLPRRTVILCLLAGLFAIVLPSVSFAQPYIDNETIYPNQDPNNETRRSDHFRLCFGHYNRDTGTPVTEQFAQGNLQMFENLWQRNIVELGLNDMGQSAILENRDGNYYRTNFLFLMTWNDNGGGGAFMSMDGMGYSYAMSNSGNCRYDPPSGATPHEIGHCWEGQARGFNGSDSSGAWWECTANWFMLQLLNTYPTDGIIANGMYYPVHGRDYYGCFTIWETFREDPRYGTAFINDVWTNATPDQQAHEYIIDRMARLDSSGSPDKSGASRDMWGEMAKKRVTWDFERQQWLARENRPETDPNYWEWYQRCRTPLVKVPGTTGWYRPERSHIPMEYGFDIIPLTASPNTTVSCNFQPMCDPVRQSDWRACLVAVNNNGDAKYSCLWSKGTNSITLSADESKLYLVVTPTPKPMNVWAWDAYRNDAGLQFPFAVSFANATPTNVVYPVYTGTHTHHPNGGGLVQSGATVAGTAYVGPNAQVLDGAQVMGYARIEDYAVVRNNAVVEGNAVVSGHAVVQDSAHVYGNAKVRDWGRAFGNAQISQNAKVIEHANCGDSGNSVSGSAVIKGTTYVYSPSTFNGSVILDGDSANGGTADHGVHFGWQWGQNQKIFDDLPENGYIYAQHSFERENAVFAWDEYGINQGFLMNGARVAADTTRGGLVLPLDGVSQYVELHNSINDFRETSICTWVKWTGSANDQRVWSMGDGASRVMYLTPRDTSTGKLRFVITDGATTQALDGTSAIPANTWTHVAVVFGSPVFNTTTRTWSATGKLYVNGTQVSTLPGMLVPDSLNAPLMENANYLGRGNAGNYFQGCLDDFRVYSKTLSSTEVLAVYSAAPLAAVTVTADTTPPTPDRATWLVAPMPVALSFDPVTKEPLVQSDNAITMSATPGTDESNWVEYYFTCTSEGGHDSGWVSFNKYTDVGLTPGTSYTYTVKMRDKNGNTTAPSAAMSTTTKISTAGAASFAYGPVGINSGAITMAATKLTNPSGLVEYKFTRNDGLTSGWQSSPSWTNANLGPDSIYTYTVQVRDGRGNVSPVSAARFATAKDMAAPKLPALAMAHWIMMPYATIDNRVSMTAMDASDPNGVQYYFQCTSGNCPDSGWQDSPTYLTPVRADGTYSFRYKIRDKSGLYNESGYSTTYSATIKPTTGYHTYSLAQLASLPDDYLVTFTGAVTRVNANNYIVRDLATGASIAVKPSTYAEATNPAYVFKNVTVSGHLYTLGGSRIVTYATVTVTGPAPSYTISGTVKTDAVPASSVDGAQIVVSEIDAVDPFAAPLVSTTSAGGTYSLSVMSGTYKIAARKAGLTTYYGTVTVGGSSVNKNIVLSVPVMINIKVTNPAEPPADLVGVEVAIAAAGASDPFAAPLSIKRTDASGQCVFNDIGKGTYKLGARLFGYTPIKTDLAANGNTSLTIAMQPSGALVRLDASTVPVGATRWTNTGSLGGKFVVSNGVFPTRATVGSYGALTFNGNTQLRLVDDSGAIVNAATAAPAILGNTSNNPNYTVVFWTYRGANGGGEAVLGLGPQFKCIFNYGGGWGIEQWDSIGCFNTDWDGNAPPAMWHQVVIKNEGPVQKMFFDGVLKHTFNHGFGSYLDTYGHGAGNPITVGAAYDDWGNPMRHFQGSIASLRIYDTAVPDADVPGVYASDVPTGFPTPIAVANLAALKAKPADALVTLTGSAIVTYAPRNASNARTTNFFYIAEKQALGGLKVVDKSSDTLTIGNKVTSLTGYLRKPIGKEMYLELATDPTGTGNTPILPLGMNNRTVLIDHNAQTNAVKIWGKVKSVNGTTSFVIHDGYKYGAVTVKLNGVPLPSGFASGKTAVVTGVITRDDAGKVIVLAQDIKAR